MSDGDRLGSWLLQLCHGHTLCWLALLQVVSALTLAISMGIFCHGEVSAVHVLLLLMCILLAE